MSRRSLFRLGLYQLGAGIVSVLLLGVLNRVLRVEMGLDLLVVGIVVGGGHYLGALAAMPFGYFSDRHPFWGLHRTPFIIGGIGLVCLALAAAPFVVRELAMRGGGIWVAGAFVFFLLEGIATYIAGTAYLALITDLTAERDRGRAVALVWTLLMGGILAGVFFTVITLREYSFASLSLSFAVAAGSVLTLAIAALWHQEPRATAKPRQNQGASFSESFKMLASSRPARCFFAFLVVGLFATFMQDVVLEPFGGEVLKLPVRATSLFNAYQMVGVIAAMWVGGARLIPRYGKEKVTAWGAWVQAGAFALLAVSSVLQWAWLANPAILALGIGMGLFTVGGVSLMMDMTQTGQTGLFVGAWTLAQALAKGPAAVASSGLHNAARAIGAEPAAAYATVFLVEAAGLAVAVWLLHRVGVPRFSREAVPFSSVLTQSVD